MLFPKTTSDIGISLQSKFMKEIYHHKLSLKYYIGIEYPPKYVRFNYPVWKMPHFAPH